MLLSTFLLALNASTGGVDGGIHWSPDPELFNIGSISIRYYGLLWIVGIACSYFMVRRQYKDKKIGDDKFDPLFLYCFFGMLIGSRLGHCIFYDPEYFFGSWKHFIEMIVPIHFLPDGGWKFTGYTGLASHGGTLGLILSLALYCHRSKMNFVDVLDMIAVATPICACCIRLANLMNSEIIGRPTDVPWAFVFERVDMVPRHPAQLYEAIAYFIFFLGMIYLYKRGLKQRKAQETPLFGKHTQPMTLSYPYRRGFFFGLCLTEIFAFRFFIEFLKENQVAFEDSMSLNMGQWLSIPFVLVGIYFMCFYGKNK